MITNPVKSEVRCVSIIVAQRDNPCGVVSEETMSFEEGDCFQS